MKILVIEDHQQLQTNIRNHLRGMGYVCEVAGTLTEAEMKLLLTCGGTAGHVYPAVALAHLASPSRGLFLFSPFLVFAVIAGMRRLHKFPLDMASFCLYAAMVQLSLFSCWRTWTAGSAFGPRYLCEAAMLLCVAMTTSLADMNWATWKGRVFAALVLFACILHLTGGSQGDRGWTANAYVQDSLRNAWNLPNSQIAWTFGFNP